MRASCALQAGVSLGGIDRPVLDNCATLTFQSADKFSRSRRFMVLHLGSIWLIGALTAFVFGVLMFVVRPAQPDHLARAFLLTALSSISLSLSFLLRSGAHVVPEMLRYVVANTLTPLGLGFGYRAVSDLKRRASSRGWIYLPPAAAFGFSLWFNFIRRNISICQLLYNVENVVLLLAIVVLMQRRGRARAPKADRMGAAAFLLLALSTTTALVLMALSGGFPVEYNFDQPLAVYNVIVTITFTSLIYFILLLMIFERLNEELQVQALRDPLTGVYNRRAFEEIAFREISGARRSGLPLALIVCDIDSFKSVNDTFGHLAGDEVLVEVAKLLRANLRDEDSLCRWGGRSTGGAKDSLGVQGLLVCSG
jgi:predicted signal transduction protein with EAL and GGDEF domain